MSEWIGHCAWLSNINVFISDMEKMQSMRPSCPPDAGLSMWLVWCLMSTCCTSDVSLHLCTMHCSHYKVSLSLSFACSHHLLSLPCSYLIWLPLLQFLATCSPCLRQSGCAQGTNMYRQHSKVNCNWLGVWSAISEHPFPYGSTTKAGEITTQRLWRHLRFMASSLLSVLMEASRNVDTSQKSKRVVYVILIVQSNKLS